jgi:hypothetical protein
VIPAQEDVSDGSLAGLPHHVFHALLPIQETA